VSSLFLDVATDDATRRERLYCGDLVVRSPQPAARALCDFAFDLAGEVFAPLDPETAQDHLPVERYAEILSALKPRFIHHERSKELVCAALVEWGCDPETTYFDVPRLRTSTHGGYLTSGIAYAFHPHRDTWYSAPQCQINWWLPVRDVQPDNVMAFHLRYWDAPIRNGSHDYDYEEWTQIGRKSASSQIGKDTRRQPHPEEPFELDPQIRVICPVGGVIAFSAAHMHSSVPNTTDRTRLSIDFRTVNLDDLADGVGAPNMDSECTGTNLGDFLRVSDLSPLPQDVIDAGKARKVPLASVA
jgi:hypothetical protein